MIELPDGPPVEMPAREAARRRFALDGANAQALEGALSGVERLLRDLLAAIHGDGGQHEQRHGLEESCRQAHLSLTRLRDELHRLRWGVAANAGCRSTEPAPRWAHVVNMTGLGSTSAHQLCHAAGFDPEEIVGKAQEDLGVALLRLDREAARKEVYASAWEAAILDGATRDQAHQIALDAANKEWPR